MLTSIVALSRATWIYLITLSHTMCHRIPGSLASKQEAYNPHHVHAGRHSQQSSFINTWLICSWTTGRLHTTVQPFTVFSKHRPLSHTCLTSPRCNSLAQDRLVSWRRQSNRLSSPGVGLMSVSTGILQCLYSSPLSHPGRYVYTASPWPPLSFYTYKRQVYFCIFPTLSHTHTHTSWRMKK